MISFTSCHFVKKGWFLNNSCHNIIMIEITKSHELLNINNPSCTVLTLVLTSLVQISDRIPRDVALRPSTITMQQRQSDVGLFIDTILTERRLVECRNVEQVFVDSRRTSVDSTTFDRQRGWTGKSDEPSGGSNISLEKCQKFQVISSGIDTC